MHSTNKRIDCSHIYSMYENDLEKGNLYLSSVSMLKEYQELKARKIDCILTILDDWAYNKFTVKERIEHLKLGVYHRINLEDDEEATIYHNLQFGCDYIKKNLEKTNVLVHCQGGVSRSSSFVIAFLMKEKGFSLEEATKFTKERRKNISPNDAFKKELVLWEQNLKKIQQK